MGIYCLYYNIEIILSYFRLIADSQSQIKKPAKTHGPIASTTNANKIFALVIFPFCVV